MNLDRIAPIAGRARHPEAAERVRGYRAAHRAAGIEPARELVVPGLFTEESGLAAVGQLLDGGERFSAIFAANDQMALGACLGLHRRGIRVPTDVSLVGFDNLAASRFWLPPLTTVDHPAYEIGRLAAVAMLQLLRGDSPAVTVPSPRLIVRESTRALQAGATRRGGAGQATRTRLA